MRITTAFVVTTGTVLLSGCIAHGTNPEDPYESINRKTHAFNMVFDKYILKPPAVVYKAVIPAAVRASVNNFYNNIYMLPIIANDMLQGEWRYVSDDTGRLFINSTLGIGGLFDVATQYNLPLRNTDLGLTFAKWGDKQSPYIVIPFLGPSTIRDGMGMMFEYALFTPYPYLTSDSVLYGLLGLRYIDIRSQYLEKDSIIDEALDKYSFIRDAYLQHRHYLITGEQPVSNEDSAYVEDEEQMDYVDETPSTPTINSTESSPATVTKPMAKK